MNLRQSVKRFAARMEQQLEAHDRERGRYGWHREGVVFLMRRLQDEVAELVQAMYHVPYPYDAWDSERIRRRIANEAADVANFAMMIADNVTEPKRWSLRVDAQSVILQELGRSDRG